jgi:hypothetical protein
VVDFGAVDVVDAVVVVGAPVVVGARVVVECRPSTRSCEEPGDET